MNFFQSDNIWKQQRRRMKKAQRPDNAKTRLEDARNSFISSLLWLAGAVFLDILALICAYLGYISLEGTTLAFVVVLTLYAAISIAPCLKAYRHWQDLKQKLQ